MTSKHNEWPIDMLPMLGFFALLVWLNNARWFYVWLILVGSVAIHESAHFLAACLVSVRSHSLHFGIGPDLLRIGKVHIGMLPIVGYVRLDEDDVEHASGWGNAFISLAGPVANLAVTAAFVIPIRGLVAWVSLIADVYGATFSVLLTPFKGGSVVTVGKATVAGEMHLLELFFILNLAMGTFNLLPLMPLDGGKLVHLCINRYVRHDCRGMINNVLIVMGVCLTLIPCCLLLLRDLFWN